jgi:diguanylate cyclase (GGDEF)-like protein
MLVIALIAVFQAIVLVWNLDAQQGVAHIIDISGQQRQRSTRLAYFALSLTTPYPEPHAREATRTIVADILATRRELLQYPEYRTGPIGRDGSTALERLGNQYISAVLAVEARPADRRAVETMQRLRPLVLAAYDAAVKARVAVFARHNAEVLAMVLAGLFLQIATILGVWLKIVAPSEAKSRRLLAEVRESRRQIESTFLGNPDAVAIYDARGFIIRANPMRESLLGLRSTSTIRQHYCEVVEVASRPAADALFERALAGEVGRADLKLVAGSGTPIEADTIWFPYTVDGVTIGVTMISKDVRQLRAVEAVNAEQQRRLVDLYEIASAYGRTTQELLTSAISLVAARLGYDYGVITEIVDDVVTPIASNGPVRGITLGKPHPLTQSLAQLALDEDVVFESADFLHTSHASEAIRHLGWHSVAGMKMLVGGTLYGTIGFAARAERTSGLSDADVIFMRLACAILATIIERGRQLRRLDALAFFDTLTGLPNRAQFHSRIDQLLQTKTRFSLQYVDLDRFKEVNDRLGHAAGDEVLRIAAQRLLGCVRAGDMVARLGGDEFVVLQTIVGSRSEAAVLAKRIVNAFVEPIHLDGAQVDVGASVGIAIRPRTVVEARELIDAADSALYRAKRAGRRQFVQANAFGGESGEAERLEVV